MSPGQNDAMGDWWAVPIENQDAGNKQNGENGMNGDCVVGAKASESIKSIRMGQEKRDEMITELFHTGQSLEKEKVGSTMFYRFLLILTVVFSGIFGMLWANNNIIHELQKDIAVISSSLQNNK